MQCTMQGTALGARPIGCTSRAAGGRQQRRALRSARVQAAANTSSQEAAALEADVQRELQYRVASHSKDTSSLYQSGKHQLRA